MDYTTFGKTGLKTSVAGLGCGGHSRLGLSHGASSDDAVNLIRTALDLGVTFLDTAAVYKTEEVVGRAVKSRRDQIVISTKVQIPTKTTPATNITPAALRASVDASLTRLGTDYIDIFNLHGLALKHYDYATTHLVPELQNLRTEGKIRFIGVTEQFIHDPAHKMLIRALQDDIWDVMMIGFNIVNPSARNTVFTHTKPKGIATQIMFAVRRALSQPDALAELLQSLTKSGHIPADAYDPENPLGFLLDDSDATSLTNAAYRFCRHEPGAEVILTGTSSADHLRQNIAAINGPPLSTKSTNHLRTLFGQIDSVSGN